jgi:hypothetical protein
MIFKAINNTVGPDSLIPIVLVFGAYLRISLSNILPALIAKRSQIVKKIIIEVQRFHTARQVADAVKMKNSPITIHLHKLPLEHEVLVYKESKR